MTSGHSSIQAAVYSRISGVISVPVYDQVPESAQGSYVSLGEGYGSSTNESKDSRGRQNTLSLNVWTTSNGFKTAQGIVDEIVNAIEDLVVAGFDVVDSSYSTELLREPDGKTRRIVLDLSYELDPN